MLCARRIGLTSLAAALAVGAWAACYSPSLDGDGRFYCRDPQQRCPEGFVCGADRICVRPGQPSPPADAGADAAAPEGGPPPEGGPQPTSLCRLTAPIEIGQTTADLKGTFGVAVDYDSGNIIAAYERGKSLQISRKTSATTDWVTSEPGVSGGTHVAIDVIKDEALVAFRGKDQELRVLGADAATGSTTDEYLVDPEAGDHIAASFNPTGGVWVAYTVRGTATKNQLRVARVNRGSLALMEGPMPVPQPEGLKGHVRLTSIGGKPYLAFISTVGTTRIDAYVEPYAGDWQSPAAVGDVADVPAAAIGIDIFGAQAGGLNVVHTMMDPAARKPVLRLANAGRAPEIVAIDGKPILEAGSPTMISAEGATALAFIDLQGKAHFTARTTPDAAWEQPLAFDDTGGGAATFVTQIELIGAQDQGLSAVYRAGARLLQRTIVCDFE